MSPDPSRRLATGVAGPDHDDLALAAARFGAVLRAAGVPADPGRCERFAMAVTVARPAVPQALYLCALATLTSSPDHVDTLRRAFAEVFGVLPGVASDAGDLDPAGLSAGLPSGQGRVGSLLDAGSPELMTGGADEDRDEVAGEDAQTDRDDARAAGEDAQAGWGEVVGEDAADWDEAQANGEDARAGRHVLANAAERLASTDFAELSPAEVLLLSGLMRRLTLAVPLRRSRRPRPTPRGRRTDLRATLRQARRTGGHPMRLARRPPLLEPRPLVVLCDISGSMEPYARAMLQLLYCAAGGARAEVFTFATRLTRLTGTLAHARPGLALQRAGQAAPDWLGGTRIGDSIAEFNDNYGRRGMARGAVVVVISDGWDTGDPAVLRREMERLSRVAHRIIWVNPRTQSPEYQPLAGGMAAAWPYCDAVVSAHSLRALDDLTAALAHAPRRRSPTRARTRRDHGDPAVVTTRFP
jgi:uncharacterized protein